MCQGGGSGGARRHGDQHDGGSLRRGAQPVLLLRTGGRWMRRVREARFEDREVGVGEMRSLL